MKRLVIIGAGVEQIYAYQLAQSLNITTIGTDIDPNAPAFEYADHKLIASTRDPKETLKVIQAFHKDRPIDGIMTVANDVPYTVAFVANALGLKSMELSTSEITSDKILMKNVLSDADVSVPSYQEVSNISDIKKAILSWGYPIIIKPIDNRGARGVLKIDEDIDLEWAFHYALGFSEKKRVMIERYILGPQISSEGFVINGECITVALADRNYEKLDIYKPYIIEDGGTMPSNVTQKVKDDIQSELQKAADAIGLKDGPIKGDIVIDKNEKAYIIEVATRLSGGNFCTDMIPLSLGIDLVKQTIKYTLGLEINMDDLKEKKAHYVAIRYWFPNMGCLKSIPDISMIQKEKGVIKAEIHHSIGTRFDQIEKHPDRLGFIIVKDTESYAAAEKRAIKIISKYTNDFIFE